MDETGFILSIVGFALSAILSYLILPWVMNSSLEQGLTTVDAHKAGKPTIPEPGGLAPLISFVFSLLLIILVITITNPDFNIPISLLAGTLSVLIGGFIGFFDDVFKIKWRHKILLGFLPALPLMALEIGNTTVDIPIIGIIDFGKILFLPFIGYINLYSFLIIPLAVNFAFNSFNMLAGFNGLEAGNGIISLAIILFASLLSGDIFVSIFVSTLLGGFLVLLRFNWYPAKTLIGDTGTLTLGTAIIVALILGNMERLALGLFFLHFINFVLFMFYIYTKQEAKIATIDEKTGVIVAPNPYTMYWLIPYIKKTVKERENVIYLLILHSIFSVLILLLSIGYFTN